MADSNAHPVVIHRMSPENISLLSRLAPDVFDESISDSALAKFVRVSDHALYVAVAEERVVGQVRGVIHYQPDLPNELYVDNLGVAPAHQRSGIATNLLRRLCTWGRKSGCKSMWVATEIDNEDGIGFYKSLGLEAATIAYFQADISGSDSPIGEVGSNLKSAFGGGGRLVHAGHSNSACGECAIFQSICPNLRGKRCRRRIELRVERFTLKTITIAETLILGRAR